VSSETPTLPDRTENQLFNLVTRLVNNADANSLALVGQLNGLRWEVRIIVLVTLMLMAVRDGAFTKLGLPGLTFETHPAGDHAYPEVETITPTSIVP